MTRLSGWCASYGASHHKNCRRETCECDCHGAKVPAIVADPAPPGDLLELLAVGA